MRVAVRIVQISPNQLVLAVGMEMIETNIVLHRILYYKADKLTA